MDFGIAKVLEASQLSTGKRRTQAEFELGTIEYMSPEQIRTPLAVGPRSDIFALGVMLYQLLTGTTPFPGENPFDVKRNIVEGRYAPAGSLTPEVSPLLDACIARALAPDPEARFADCGAMSQALLAAIDAGGSAVGHAVPGIAVGAAAHQGVAMGGPPAPTDNGAGTPNRPVVPAYAVHPPEPPPAPTRSGLPVVLAGLVGAGGLLCGVAGVLAILSTRGDPETAATAQSRAPSPPGATAPQATAPQATAPQATAQQATAQQATAPQATAQQATASAGNAASSAIALPGWIICIGAFNTRSEAQAQASKFAREGIPDTGVLWIPDYGSLSGAKMWLAYSGPIPQADVRGARARLSQVQRIMRDAYGLLLDKGPPRIKLEP
ncbi:MAG: protein kinase [Deltaproteobacteria bacterium]|nr:protein kinase [Deltaproteobacteria bacterium]